MKIHPDGNKNHKTTPAVQYAGVVNVKSSTRSRTHEIVRDRLYDKIEASISQISELTEILASEIQPEEMLQKLESFYSRMLSSSSPETLKKLEDIRSENEKRSSDPEYAHEYTGIERFTIHEDDMIIDDSEAKKMIMISNGIIRIRDKLEEILLFKNFPALLDSDDVDMIFEKKIRGTHFEETFKKVLGSAEEMDGHDPFMDIPDLDDIDLDDIDLDEVGSELPVFCEDKKRLYRKYAYLLSDCESMRLEFDSLGIMVHLDDHDYDNVIQDRSIGSYIPGTALSFIRASVGEKEVKLSRDHEKSHNIYHSFVPGSGIINKEVFTFNFNNIEKLISLNAPEDIIRNNFRILERKIAGFFESSQDEIVANFKELKKGRLATELSNYADIIKDLKSRKSKLISGKKPNGILAELSEHLDKTINALYEYYSIFYRRLADLVYISDKEGLDKELFASIILFSPLRYDKIEKYFRMKIGDDRYDLHCTIRSIVNPEFFMMPKTKIKNETEYFMDIMFGSGKGTKTEKELKIAMHKDHLSPQRIKRLSTMNESDNMNTDVDDICRKLKDTDFKKIFFRFDISGSQKYLRYRRRLLRLLKKLGMKREKRNEVGRHLDGEYVYHLTYHKERIKLTEDILDNFPAYFDEFLEFIMREVVEFSEDDDSSQSMELKDLILNHRRSNAWFGS